MSTRAVQTFHDPAGPATVPAPPVESGPSRSGEREAARPTTIPDYDVEARAASSHDGASAPPDGLPADLPLERAIPVRRRASIDGAPLRAAFLLYHVDDRMSVGEIARSAQIPIADATECFVLLADLGLVELRAPG